MDNLVNEANDFMQRIEERIAHLKRAKKLGATVDSEIAVIEEYLSILRRVTSALSDAQEEK